MIKAGRRLQREHNYRVLKIITPSKVQLERTTTPHKASGTLGVQYTLDLETFEQTGFATDDILVTEWALYGVDVETPVSSPAA